MSSNNYSTAWAQYRHQRSLLIFATAVGPLLFVACAFFGVLGDSVAIAVAVLWFVSSMATSFRLLGFRCPRCRNTFVMKDLRRNPVTRHCLYRPRFLRHRVDCIQAAFCIASACALRA
jgi:hypothetical protein